ncbi:hypothetical protein AVEN_150491-1, partial [Araneus ventricosus]
MDKKTHDELFRRPLSIGVLKWTKFSVKEPFSFYDDTIFEYAVSLRELLLFETIDRPQVFLGIHSPFIPMNPVTNGHALIGGYNYRFEVQLEKEEHLLPPPYQTSCKDNGPSEDAESFTNPNSFQLENLKLLLSMKGNRKRGVKCAYKTVSRNV